MSCIDFVSVMSLFCYLLFFVLFLFIDMEWSAWITLDGLECSLLISRFYRQQVEIIGSEWNDSWRIEVESHTNIHFHLEQELQ